MQARSVGMREFRAGPAEFIDARDPVAVTRHGQTVGTFIPTPRPSKAPLQALRDATSKHVHHTRRSWHLRSRLKRCANIWQPCWKRAKLWRASARATSTTGPVLACALVANYPIWTEDRDFFATGVATWTTALVELCLSEPNDGPAEQ
jgi:hypothetical protein